MVVVNACIRTFTAFSHDELPEVWANAAEARISEQEQVTNAGRSQGTTNLFRRNFFIAGDFLSDDASWARTGIQRQAPAGLFATVVCDCAAGGVSCGEPPRSRFANRTRPFVCRSQAFESYQRVLIVCGELLRLRRLLRRIIRRELRSTYTTEDYII
jgi:hypothetical protein